jgi:hypothetical protein
MEDVDRVSAALLVQRMTKIYGNTRRAMFVFGHDAVTDLSSWLLVGVRRAAAAIAAFAVAVSRVGQASGLMRLRPGGPRFSRVDL